VANSGSAYVGAGAGSGKVNVQDIAVTKFVNSSSPKLMLACCKGTHYASAQLTVRKAGGKALEYVKVKMEEVLVSSVATGGSQSKDRLIENVNLNFGKVSVDYTQQKDDGSAGTAIPFGWDIAAN
jgi:type VI secretion system secreted protein Hcp